MKSVGTTMQYACFSCQKSFKRPQFSPSANRFMNSEQHAAQTREATEFEATRDYKCPDCGQPAHMMGLDFKAPRKGDAKAWKAVQDFILSGKTYYRGTK